LAACQRKRLRLAQFPSKRNARNASDWVWMETGLQTDANERFTPANLICASKHIDFEVIDLKTD